MVVSNYFLQWLIICMALICIWSGCASLKKAESLDTYFSEPGPFQDHSVGFALYDPVDEKWLFRHHADKYFTPASNTKILTLYATLHYLSDSLIGAAVHENEDTLFIWGMGDPTLLHPRFSAGHHLLDKINNYKPRHLVFCQNHFKDLRFGSGWAWDDYVYGYQVEKSALPIYANRLRIQIDSATQSITYTPASITINRLQGDQFSISRNEHDNQFNVETIGENQVNYTYNLPLHRTADDIPSYLSTFTSKIISVQDRCNSLPTKSFVKTSPLDTVLRRLMHQSDNFIAEQLLLQISALELGEMHTSRIIQHIKQDLMPEISDQLLWFDGSGLSRYNMFTPAALVHTLHKIKSLVPLKTLLDIFPAGGKSGTIKSYYGSDPPFVFAKTGTLRNKHCLSGYLLTDRGKTLIFSFMHNNYPGPSADTKPGMDQILRFIKSNY